jgi:hypothetical protein
MTLRMSANWGRPEVSGALKVTCLTRNGHQWPDPVRPPLDLTGFLSGDEPDHQLDLSRAIAARRLTVNAPSSAGAKVTLVGLQAGIG